MNDLLKLAIDAHGGLSQWEKLDTISAHLRCAGVLWQMKGHAGTLDDLYVTVNLKKQEASHYPFIKPNWHTVYKPGEVLLEDETGKVIEVLKYPRASFKGHTLETPWTNLQLAYFVGYAMWTYFNAPFNFASPGYEVSEIDPWEENGEVWRRLKVKFPDAVGTHSSIQVFYIGRDGLVKRHDYDVDISGGAGAVHYSYDYVQVEGIMVATKRKVYVRNADNTALLPDPLLVSIDLSEIEFTRSK